MAKTISRNLTILAEAAIFLMLYGCGGSSGAEDGEHRIYPVSYEKIQSNPMVSKTRNNPPTISIERSEIGPGNTLTLEYTIADPEGDSILVSIWLEDLLGHQIQITQSDLVKNRDLLKCLPGSQKAEINLPGSYTSSFSSVRILAEDLFYKGHELSELVSIDSLEKDILMLNMPRSYSDSLLHSQAVRNISTSFRQYFDEFGIQPFDYLKIRGKNLLGLKNGYQNSSNYLLVGAHYDTVEDSPGADDNASGVASLMEIGRVLNGFVLKRPLQVVAFDLEEEGGVGSYYFTANNGLDSAHHVSGAIIIDMIGYRSTEEGSQVFPEELKAHFPGAFAAVSENAFRGDFVICVYNETSESLARSLTHRPPRQYTKIVPLQVRGAAENVPDLARGDQGHFWRNNIPTVFIGDGADTRNPHYNSPSDTPATLDLEFLTQNVKAILMAVVAQCEPRHGSIAVAEILTGKKN